MSTVYRYAIIRFRPLIETDEFANIGVVACDVERGVIRYKMAPSRFRRVTQFFADLPAGLYKKSVRFIEFQLERLVYEELYARRSDIIKNFYDFVQSQEALCTFSELRSIEADTGLQETVYDLYDLYVRRMATGVDNREAKMVSDLRKRFKYELAGFKPYKIRDDVMPLTFSLALRSDKLRLIKPIAFDQKSPISIIDHGAVWRDRFSYLFSRDIISPEDVLVPLEVADDVEGSAVKEASDIARQHILSINVQAVSFDDYSWLANTLRNFSDRANGVRGGSLFN